MSLCKAETRTRRSVMAGLKLAGYRPECPRAEHKHSNVRRYGYHGKEGHRRVRWKCVPTNGDKPHEFSEALPRQTTHSGFCEECERGFAHHEGPQSAREYAFSIREVAAGSHPGWPRSLLQRGSDLRPRTRRALAHYPERQGASHSSRSTGRRLDRGFCAGSL